MFPRIFPTVASTKGFVRNSEALPNRVYGMPIKDLGNNQPGDGWKDHGMGPIQATGRRWATRIGTILGLDLVNCPELMLHPATGWRAAAAIWHLSGCNKFADADDFNGETRPIVGWANGLAQRQAFRKLAEALLFAPVAMAE